MKISPFTPLHFREANESDGLPSRYIQTWAPTDHILIEVIADVGDTAPAATLNNAHTGASLGPIEFLSWQMNTAKLIFFAVLTGMSVGHYTVTIAGKTCDEFRVTDDTELLARTTLIQYRFKDNKSREDVVAIIDHMTYFFDFRVPGGFKAGGWQFGVSNEQFTTQREDVVELFANDYTMKTFTMGNALGVPPWYAEHFNRLLTCSYVYFNGDRYTRSDTETPQIQVLMDGLDSFVFTQVLRKAQVLDAKIEAMNQAIIRRIDDAETTAIYRGVDQTIPNSNINRKID